MNGSESNGEPYSILQFAGAAFGRRGDGEGDKTCLPWLAAVGVIAHEERLRRYGSTDIASIEKQRASRANPAG